MDSSCIWILTNPQHDFSEIKFDSHITKVVASGLGLQSLRGLENNTHIQELDVSDNELISLEYAPKNLKRLRCSKNKITSLQGLGEGLVSLECSFNHLTNLKGCPSSVIDLVAVHCFITDMSDLPKFKMNRVYLSHNEIKKIYAPLFARTLDLSCNLLSFVEIEITGIEELMLCNNNFCGELIVKTKDMNILRISDCRLKWLKVYNESKTLQLIQAKKNWIEDEDILALNWVKELYI